MKLTEKDLDQYLEYDPGVDDDAYIFDISDYAPRTRELIRLARLGLWAEEHAIPALTHYSNTENWIEDDIGSMMNPQKWKKIDSDNGKTANKALSKLPK